jgi:Cu(I)/Ag(I) efflux system membrane protein CusA/SilA
VVDAHNNGSERRHTSPLAAIIDFSARRPVYTLFIVLCLSLWGYRSLLSSPLDAIPDLSDVQVIVLTEWAGRSPDLVEDQVTYPLTTSLLAAPNVQFVRGQSFMGLSFVYVIFEDGTDIYWARSRVAEQLSAIAHKLPEHARPALGPDATGIGWVFQYALVDRTGQNDLGELRALQDFSLRYWLESVPGVAEVASIGGYNREYQVQVDPYKLARNGVTLDQLAKAIRASNNDVGGRVLEIAGHEHFVRGRGYIKDKADIENIVIPGGMMPRQPVRLADVATVSLGPAMQRGIADLDGLGQAVGGIVVMRHGENALEVIERVKQRLQEIKGGLPNGVEVVPVYDRSGLIERAIDTLKNALIEEMLAVAAILLLFLLHVRSALVAVITLPVAILLAFIPMGMQGVTANIMSLGGIAVAIGAMVDAAVVIIDNIHKRLQQETAARREVVIDAMREVGPSIFFSLLIITVSFLPVFALQGSEGRLFHPLAYTKTYAMAFAALLSITLIPALAVLLIHGRPPRLQASVNSGLMRLYRPVVRLSMRLRWGVLALFCAALAASLPIASSLNSEFMPPLNEGSILYMPTSLPGMSISEAAAVLQSMDTELSKFPEVERVFGKMGRATTATDPAPLSMAEIVVTLKPPSEWREGMTWDTLIEQMNERLSYPGMPNIWWMPVQTRVEMLTTGIRSALGIKVFGENLEQIEATAVAIERALADDSRTGPFTRSAFAERLTGGYFLDFDIKRDELARYGMTVEQVEKAIMAAVGGIPLTEVIDGRERYSINLRYARDFRDDPQALERILVPVSSMPMGRMGARQIPISQVADIRLRTGPPMLRNEDGMLVGFVFVDVADDIGIADYVEQAKAVVADTVDIPPGYRLAWAGQYKHFERARDRLQVLVPLTLFIVFFMLYVHRGSFADALLVMSMVPFSLLGSVWLIHLLGYKLSVAVWVGMIAMAGLAAEMGLLMLFYLDHALRQAQARGEVNDRASLITALTDGATQRIRPMLMTMITLVASLLPVMLNEGSGSDVMKRIAAPMAGGIISTMLVVLLLMPALFALRKAWRDPASLATPPHTATERA